MVNNNLEGSGRGLILRYYGTFFCIYVFIYLSLHWPQDALGERKRG
jgi:hypothetical protein